MYALNVEVILQQMQHRADTSVFHCCIQTAEAMSSLWRSNSTLREVDVSANALGIDGGRLLREALAENTYAFFL